ncbi:MAG: T9SS type A sorting domain-containing protein [Bacteroidota bacterium]
MKRLLLLFFVAQAISTPAQNSFVKIWDYRFGGDADDVSESFKQTKDGGFIIGGYSRSQANGDKTEANRDTTTTLQYRTRDYWIVKINSYGEKQWDKTFGGVGNDYFTGLCLCADGGYLIGGYSDSQADHDKSDALKGIQDFWIIKIDSLGNKQWDKDFGVQSFSHFSWLYDVIQTYDKGYVLGGYTDGDATGDKSEPNYGNDDYWIIKIDSLGNKQWDKAFGGGTIDDLRKVLQTPDSGFLLGGTSYSSISGNKTEPTFGGPDYWIVKTDSVGNKLWEKDFGGDNGEYFTTLRMNSDGGFMLGGISYSNASGIKTENTRDTSSNPNQLGDYWIMKTDSIGNKLWDKDYGGYLGDNSWMTDQDIEGNGYIISGNTSSDIGGDKTENNLGMRQLWLVKADSVGNPTWNKTIFSPGNDGRGFVIQENEHCYLVAGNSDADSGGYKSQNNRGGYDYWVLKFCDSTYIEAAFEASTHLCSGACIDFTNFSINTSTYQWNFTGGIPANSTDPNPHVCYNTAGAYDVSLIAANATESDTITMHNYITVYPYFPQSIVQSGDTLYSNEGAYGYQWFHNGSLIIGATNYFYTLTDSGDYNVICKDTNGCEVEAAIFDVHIGIEDLGEGGRVNVFPNPTSDGFTIYGTIPNSKFSEMKLFNSLGNEIYTVHQDCSKPFFIKCESFAAGIYLLKVLCRDRVFTTIISIQH